MKILNTLLILGLLLLTACAGTRVMVDEEYENFSLSEYQTFDFYKIEAPDSQNPDLQKSMDFLQQRIAEEMKTRGLTQSSENPDLKINLGVKIEDKVQTRTTSLATDPFMYTGQRSYTWRVREIPVNTYREGSLRVDLVDTERNEAVWIGTVDQVLPKKAGYNPPAIQKAVSQIFEEINSN